jgi:hypothetical protein
MLSRNLTQVTHVTFRQFTCHCTSARNNGTVHKYN